MSDFNVSGVHSDTNSPHQKVDHAIASGRPAKMQKIAVITPIITNFHEQISSPTQHNYGYTENHGTTSGNRSSPTSNSPHQQSEFQELPAMSPEKDEPFCYYEESHVQESVNNCKNSLIGKILSTKPIPTSVLYSTLNGIWCNPLGFKINEIEGKLYQITMDNEQDVARIVKGSPWIVRNCWLIIHAWDRKTNPSDLNFSKIPLWVQFWGLPLHCKSIMMGEQIGSQIGEVMDVGMYDYPENARILKVKIWFDITSQIRAGLYIGNEVDGVNWVDFRYENLPMFCFGCGLVGHTEDNCSSPSSFKLTANEGSTNPRGAWLRSKAFGRRVLDRKEKMFSSNPLKSVSRSCFSPIPKGLKKKMANLNMNPHSASSSPRASPNATTKNYQQETQTIKARGVVEYKKVGNKQELMMVDHTIYKRKTVATMEQNNTEVVNQYSGNLMAGLNNEASQPL